MSAPPTSSPHPGVERKWDDLSAAVESLRDLRFSTLVHISALTNSVRSNSSRLRSHVQALDTGGLDPVADREVRRLMTLIPGVEQTLQPLNSKDWSSLVSQGGEDFWRGLDITFSDSQTVLLSWISRERQTDNFELDRGNCYPPNTSVPPLRPALEYTFVTCIFPLSFSPEKKGVRRGRESGERRGERRRRGER